jgi:membrane protease subunit HflC
MKKIIGIIIGLAAIITVFSSLYTVDYMDVVLIQQFGRVVGIQREPGIHVKTPFIQSTFAIYDGSRIYDIPQSDVITRDKKSMIADDYVIWTVNDVMKYYQTLGGVSARAEERIDAAVYNATKNIISSMSQDEVIAARGIELTNMITNESNSDISGYGIQILTAEIKALDLPDDNKAAVYERMISERDNIAAGYKAKGEAEAQKIRNETDKEVSVTLANANKTAEQTRAEGEARYMEILSDAYNDAEKADFYNFTRSLDALEKSLKGTGEKTLILDRDSEIAKILYGDEMENGAVTFEPIAVDSTEVTE